MKSKKSRKVLIPLFSVLVFATMFLFNISKRPDGTTRLIASGAFGQDDAGDEGGPGGGTLLGSASLLNPPHSSTNLTFAGGQGTTLALKNNSPTSFVTITVTPQQGESWSVVIPPLSSATSPRFTIFGTTPIGWSFTISTVSDAAAVTAGGYN